MINSQTNATSQNTSIIGGKNTPDNEGIARRIRMRRVRIDESLELKNRHKEMRAREEREKAKEKVDAWG